MKSLGRQQQLLSLVVEHLLNRGQPYRLTFMSLLVILLFSAFFATKGKLKSRVVTVTEYGEVAGKTVVTLDGFTFDVFLGIPYARPPTGELRFEVLAFSA